MTPTVLFVIQFISGAIYFFFQAQFWKRMKEVSPQEYDEMGGPRSLVWDVSLWRVWKSYRYILSGGHRRLEDRSLRIMGEIVLVAAPLFFLSFVAALIALKTPIDFGG